MKDFRDFFMGNDEETQDFLLKHGARLLYKQGDVGALEVLLTDFDYLDIKLNTPLLRDPEIDALTSVITDFDYVDTFNRKLRSIQEALRLSAPVLRGDKSQLYAQLYGRLSSLNTPEVQSLFQKQPAGSWLRPLNSKLVSPGGAILLNIKSGPERKAAILSDGEKVILCSQSGVNESVVEVVSLKGGETLYTFATNYIVGSIVPVSKENSAILVPRWLQDGPVGDARNKAFTRLSARTWADRTSQVEMVNLRTRIASIAYDCDSATRITVGAEGKTLIAALTNGSLEQVDIASGRKIRVIGVHSNVSKIEISSDESFLVSASTDGSLKVWSLTHKNAKHIWTAETKTLFDFFITQDNTRLVVATENGTVWVYHMESGKMLCALPYGHRAKYKNILVVRPEYELSFVSVSAVDKLLGSGRSLVIVARVGTGLHIRIFSVGGEKVVDKGEHDLVVGETLNKLKDSFNHWSDKRELSQEERSQVIRNARSVAGYEDDELLVVAPFDNDIHVWGLTRRDSPKVREQCGSIMPSEEEDEYLGKRLFTLRGHSKAITGISMTYDGNRLVSASEDSTLKQWSMKDGTMTHTFRGHRDGIHTMAITPDGSKAISVSEDGAIKVWDLRCGGGGIRETASGIYGLDVTADGKRVVSISYDETIRVWSGRSKTLLYMLVDDMVRERFKKVEPLKPDPGGLYFPPRARIRVAPDGRRAVSMSVRGYLAVWNLSDEERLAPFSTRGLLYRFVGHSLLTGRSRDMLFEDMDFRITPDGKNVVSTTGSGVIEVWDLESGSVVRTIEEREGALRKILWNERVQIVVSVISILTVLAGFYVFGWVGGFCLALSIVILWRIGMSLAKRYELLQYHLHMDEKGKYIIFVSDGYGSKARDREVREKDRKEKGEAIQSTIRRNVAIWSLKSGEVVKMLTNEHLLYDVRNDLFWLENMNDFELSPDGTLAAFSAVTSRSGRKVKKLIVVRSLPENQIVQTIEEVYPEFHPSRMVSRLVFTSDAKHLVSIMGIWGDILSPVESETKVWNVASGEVITTVKGGFYSLVGAPVEGR